jgi:hypothetical protein
MNLILDYIRSLLDFAYVFNVFGNLAGVGKARKRFVDGLNFL